MKVLFLDFDGVLNNDSSAYIHGYRYNTSLYCAPAADPVSVELIDILVAKSDANIVVSSSWRVDKTVEELKDILCHQFGLRSWNKVIDKTPLPTYERGELRGHQVDAWLNYSAIDVDDYVIIDDSADFLDHHREHFCLIDAEYGFRVKNLLNCLDILKVKRK